MLVVRYAALAVLVLWLGVMLGDFVPRSDLLGYACGALIVTCLFVMKFVGPPPHAFIPRVAIVAAMLVVAAWSGFTLRQDPRMPLAINIALGLTLLFWYVREP